MKILKIHK